ncbi:MAG: hypothetical protein ACYCS8_11005 [Acidithiobacillus sp.]
MEEQSEVSRYFPIVEQQYPGLLAGLKSPRIEVLSLRSEDTDAACDRVLEDEQIDCDSGTFMDAIDALRCGDYSVPLPPGIILITLVDNESERIAVPIRVFFAQEKKIFAPAKKTQ